MKLTKRVVTVVLSLVMLASLLPLGTVVSAETIEKEPFYMVNCSANNYGIPDIYDLVLFYTPAINNPYADPGVRAYGSTFAEDIALEMKEDFDNRPEGTRYFQFNMLRRAAEGLNEHSVYLDDAVKMVKEWLTEFLKEYKKIGGKLDGIIVDVEYEQIEANYMYNWIYKGQNNRGIPQNKNIYSDIANDPRYATQIRPLLEERGFKFWPNPSGEKSEIWGISLLAGDEYKECRSIWNVVMRYHMSRAFNECITEPLLTYYPDAIVSDYQSPDSLSWLKQLSDYGTAGTLNAPKCGNTSNFSFYNNRIRNEVYGSAENPKYTNIPGYNKAVFGSEPFNMVMWDVNYCRKMYEATDTGLVNVWIAGYNNGSGKDHTCTTCNTPYYSETLFHMGLMNMQPSFVGYVTAGDNEAEYKASLQVISDVLQELTRVAGASDRKAIPMPVSYNGDYVLSGMYAGGRNIWRLTPNTEMVSLADFKVKDKAPTFSIDGQTIVFPQGRIIKDGNVSVVGTCGYWIETPADVMPVITSTENRYAKHPAFEENFEQYAVGTTLTSESALPKAVWDVTGAALKVQSSSGNKALAMTGTATLTNVKLPQNVTAGDSYAKQQAWELTFALPNNLSAGAALKLLSCADNDGGIKISGGKMYYDQNGSYKELSGVSLSAGTYTVKRELDFNQNKCNYSIYGSNGALLQEVKNVPMAAVTVPVTEISIACENVNGNILIDNYKLYPIGVTTDFSLYDAQFGMQLTDINQVRTKNTAYRLAWMNTTNQNMVAYVYNAKNNAVIAKVDMLAGQDGVITGVVKASSGSAVQLAVKTETGTATTLPNYDNGDFSWPTMAENFGKPIGGSDTDTTTPPTTEATTPPTTEATTPPTTEATTPPTTEATTPSTTESTTPSTTEPSESPTTEPSVPSTTEPNVTDTDKGLTGGLIALIVIGCVLLAGGGAAAGLYVFKKELFILIVKKLTGILTGADETTEEVDTAQAEETAEE